MICKKCGAELYDGAKFCGECGSIIEEIPDNDSPGSECSEDNTDVFIKRSIEMKCSKCGAEISGDGMFCSECGAPIEKLEPSNDVEISESIESQRQLTAETPSSKGGFQISKETIIVAIIALMIGALASGIITYQVAAKPVLSKLASAEQKAKDAEQTLKDAEDQLKAAEEEYAKISGIEVSNDTPKVTKIRGKATVGIDIAPGLYTAKGSYGTYSFHLTDIEGDKDFIWQSDGEEMILKAGEKIDTDDQVVTFTPVKEKE